MNNFARLTMLSTAIAGLFTTHSAHAAPWKVVADENMVAIPLELQISPQKVEASKVQRQKEIQATPPEENMVAIPPSLFDEADSVFIPITGPNYIEAGVNYHNVSNNQGDWFGQFINAQIQTDPKNRWNAQLQHQEAFHDEGYFVGVGNMHTFDETWFSEVGVGVGSEASFLPRFRADAALSRRWLDGGNLVTTAGLSYSKASETYSSYGILLGASYYFNSPWVLQVGIRSDMSNPGQEIGTSGFAAVTYGHYKNFYITGRVGYAREAYQLIGPVNITNAFNSHNAGLNLRKWVDEDWGVNLAGEYYKNPYYHRTGGIFSVFKEF